MSAGGDGGRRSPKLPAAQTIMTVVMIARPRRLFQIRIVVGQHDVGVVPKYANKILGLPALVHMHNATDTSEHQSTWLRGAGYTAAAP